MRLLLFVHSLSGGGAERVTANLANHWAARGWEVIVVTLAPRESDCYRLHPAVHRIALNLMGESANAGAGLWNNLQRIRALRTVLQQQRPQVALAIMTTANILLAASAWGIPGLVCVGSEHNHPPLAPIGRIWHTLRRYSYPRLDSVVALTVQSAEWLQTHIGAIPVAAIPNGIRWPLPRVEPVLPVDGYLAGDRRLLLAVGRLDAQKGFERLVEIFSGLATAHPSWDLVILGEGSLRSRLESQVRRLGLEKRVLLPGWAGNIGDWYRRADIYVLSSHHEGFSNTLMEALASGVPSVSFDCDTGPRDILRHGVDGLLVPGDDETALSRALDELMSDGALRARFAARAVEARERFSMDHVTAVWEGLFAELRQPHGAAVVP